MTQQKLLQRAVLSVYVGEVARSAVDDEVSGAFSGAIAPRYDKWTNHRQSRNSEPLQAKKTETKYNRAKYFEISEIHK